jgi:hypothetical protein
MYLILMPFQILDFMNHCFYFALNLRGHFLDHFDVLCQRVNTTMNMRQLILTRRKVKDQKLDGVHAQSTFLSFQILKSVIISRKNQVL